MVLVLALWSTGCHYMFMATRCWQAELNPKAFSLENVPDEAAKIINFIYILTLERLLF